MVRSEAPEPAGDGQSLGDLVALAAKDMSQLVRYEIDLAKSELKGDVKSASGTPRSTDSPDTEGNGITFNPAS